MRATTLRHALRRSLHQSSRYEVRHTLRQTPRQSSRYDVGRRSIHQSTRFEATSVVAVNAWLAEQPTKKPTWTIAGACAAHDVFELYADVVVAVDEPDEPGEPWVTVTRIPVPALPLALGSGAADALPDELADATLLALAPEQLTFALCGVGTAEVVFERLESLFPGARAVACAAPAVARQRRGAGEERLVGAVFQDFLDITPLARALAEFSTPADRAFRANAAAAREIFLPSSAPCLDGGDITPADQAVPLFVLDGEKMKEGEARVYKIFEPRYKLMIKECLDRGRTLLVIGAKDDVGSLCRVGDVTHDVEGGSVVVLHCERSARPVERSTSRAEFGLARANLVAP